MIDIRELRIGNLVQYNPLSVDKGTKIEPIKIRSVGVDPIMYDTYIELDTPFDIRFSEEDISPIPLTPEWLERLGFEKRLPHEGEDFTHWHYNGFEVWQHNEGFCHDFHFGGDVKYVHQLQNLFFALTGDELKPKE